MLNAGARASEHGYFVLALSKGGHSSPNFL